MSAKMLEQTTDIHPSSTVYIIELVSTDRVVVIYIQLSLSLAFLLFVMASDLQPSAGDEVGCLG